MTDSPDQAVAAFPVGRRMEEHDVGRGRTVRRLLMWVSVALVTAAAVTELTRRMLPQRVPATVVVRRDVARTLVLSGRVRPVARSRLGATTGGTVRSVLVRAGDHVSRGQLLLLLDDAPAAAVLAQARAALVTAEAHTRSTADQAELARQQTSRDLERARVLFAAGAISPRDLEVAVRAAAVARSELDVARARVTMGASSSLAEVARARAVVAGAVAQLALARVTAPSAATVLSRAVEQGDVVVPGRVLLDVALDGPTELVVYPREESLVDLRPGTSAVVSADAFPGSTFAARLTWVAPMVDPAQGTVEVRLAVPAPPSYLRADMTVSINIEVARHARALVVPLALVRDAGSAAPWVAVARDGRAVQRAVRLGIKGDHEVEIVSGLAEGEGVLPADIMPGRRVRLTTLSQDAVTSPAEPAR